VLIFDADGRVELLLPDSPVGEPVSDGMQAAMLSIHMLRVPALRDMVAGNLMRAIEVEKAKTTEGVRDAEA
jgi:hypothetical protein